MLLAPLAVAATVPGGLEFAFANTRVQNSGGSSYLSFDVMIRGSNSGDRLGTGIILINYSPAVFGYRVKLQNNLSVTKGTLLSGAQASHYNLYLADSLPTRLGVTYEYFLQPGLGSVVPLEFTQLVNIRIKIQNLSLPAGISFASSGMSMQQYIDDNATLFSPVITSATISEVLPATPQITSISVLNSQTTITWQSIPNCTYKVLSAAEPNSETWMCEAAELNSPYWVSAQSSPRRFYIVTATSNANNGIRRNEIEK